MISSIDLYFFKSVLFTGFILLILGSTFTIASNFYKLISKPVEIEYFPAFLDIYSLRVYAKIKK